AAEPRFHGLDWVISPALAPDHPAGGRALADLAAGLARGGERRAAPTPIRLALVRCTLPGHRIFLLAGSPPTRRWRSLHRVAHPRRATWRHGSHREPVRRR